MVDVNQRQSFPPGICARLERISPIEALRTRADQVTASSWLLLVWNRTASRYRLQIREPTSSVAICPEAIFGRTRSAYSAAASPHYGQRSQWYDCRDGAQEEPGVLMADTDRGTRLFHVSIAIHSRTCHGFNLSREGTTGL